MTTHSIQPPDQSEITAYVRYLLKEIEKKHKNGEPVSDKLYSQLPQLQEVLKNPRKKLGKKAAQGLQLFRNYLATTPKEDIPIEILTCFDKSKRDIGT